VSKVISQQPEAVPPALRSLLEDIRAQLAALTERVSRIENGPAVAPVPAVSASSPVPPPPKPEGISEEELLAISAALGAYLGVRVHIRQIRLIDSRAWAAEGRVSIQASHRLHG
jgi:methylmalonyl-CoA carboxyltransferase 12S subunit